MKIALKDDKNIRTAILDCVKKGKIVEKEYKLFIKLLNLTLTRIVAECEV